MDCLANDMVFNSGSTSTVNYWYVLQMSVFLFKNITSLTLFSYII